MPAPFDDVVLDPLISTIGWEYEYQDDVDIVTLRGRGESRSTPAPYLLRRYQIPFQVLNFDQRVYMVKFTEGRVNRLRAFKIWDFENFRAVGVPIGEGDGVATEFQLADLRGDEANSYLKPTFHPVPTGTTLPPQIVHLGGAAASTILEVAGVELDEGDDYEIDPMTGILSFYVAPADGALIEASFLYYTPVRFDGPSVKVNVNGVTGSITGEMIEVYQ